MKKIISLFLTVLIVLGVISILPASAAAYTYMSYEKNGNDITITVENIKPDQVFFYCVAYEGKRMASLKSYLIQNHDESYTKTIAMNPGYEYKFYAWENADSPKPICKELEASTKMLMNSGILKDSPLAVVKKVSTKIVEEKTTEKITFIQNGEVKSYTVLYDSTAVGMLAVGDVFQYATDESVQIDEIKMIFDHSGEVKLTDYATALEYEGDRYRFALGYLADFDGESITLATDYESDGTNITTFSNIETYKISKEENCTYSLIGRQYILVEPNYATNEISAIDTTDIAPAKNVEENKAAIVKLDKYGQATDIIVIDIGEEEITCNLPDAPEEVILEAPLAVVANVSQTLVNGEEVEKITFIQDGTIKEIIVESDSLAEGILAEGDVFKYDLNDNDKIVKVEIISDYNSEDILNKVEPCAA